MQAASLILRVNLLIHDLMNPSMSMFCMLVDSGANCHLISEEAARALGTSITTLSFPITITTAEAGAVLSTCGYISLGDCLPIVYIVPNISQCSGYSRSCSSLVCLQGHSFNCRYDATGR